MDTAGGTAGESMELSVTVSGQYCTGAEVSYGDFDTGH